MAICSGTLQVSNPRGIRTKKNEHGEVVPGSRADASCAASCIKTCTTLDDLGWPSGWRVSSPRNAFSHLRIWDVPRMLPRKKNLRQSDHLMKPLSGVICRPNNETSSSHIISSSIVRTKTKQQKKQCLRAVTPLTLSHATRWWRCCRCASVGLSLDQIGQRQGVAESQGSKLGIVTPR